MRCRYRKTIFLNEENGYTIAVFTTKDASVPLFVKRMDLDRIPSFMWSGK